MIRTIRKWKLIPGFDGYYRVSNTGKVQSCRKHGGRVAGLRGPWREMKQTEDKDGYCVIGLVNDGKQRLYKVHQLVLIAFIGPCPSGYVCRHYPDQDPKNNNLSNLGWSSCQQNQSDRKENGTDGIDHLKGSNHPLAKLDEIKVRKIRRLRKKGLSQLRIAKIFKISQTKISKIDRGLAWKHVV